MLEKRLPPSLIKILAHVRSEPSEYWLVKHVQFNNRLLMFWSSRVVLLHSGLILYKCFCRWTWWLSEDLTTSGHWSLIMACTYLKVFKNWFIVILFLFANYERLMVYFFYQWLDSRLFFLRHDVMLLCCKGVWSRLKEILMEYWSRSW